MEFIEILAVTATGEPGAYMLTIKAELNGEVGEFMNMSRPDDTYGMSPMIRPALETWLAAGKPVNPVPAPPVPSSVSARQFKLQLLATGLLDQVEAWIRSQDQAVQIAYDNSGTFVRSEPMMQMGFAALGFTSEQIDAFFLAASQL